MSQPQLKCEPCVCDQCGPSPSPTEADPNHHVSSVPSPNTWLAPGLTEKRLWGGQFLFTSFARLIPTPLFRGKEEPAPSWRPISTCPVCHLPCFPCSCSLGLPLQCWSSLELTLFLSPFSPLFLPSSSFSSYWFSTLFLRAALQSLAPVAPGISPSHVITGIHCLTVIFLLIGELYILNIYLYT